MAGRKKKQIRVYNNEGKFIETFDSQTDCLKIYFPNDISKRPLLVNNIKILSLYHKKEINVKYGTIDNKLYFFDKAINRDDVVYIHKISISKYCKKEKEKTIEVYNIQDEKIAEFRSLRLLTKMMPHINQSVINRQLNRKSLNVKRHKGLEEDLFFKYKNEL